MMANMMAKMGEAIMLLFLTIEEDAGICKVSHEVILDAMKLGTC